MSDVFDVDQVFDVPLPGRYAVLLRARTDLDLSTEKAVRSEMIEASAGPGHALLLDVTGVFVGVVLVRCLVQVAERAARAGKPLAVVGAPAWLVDMTALLDVPPLLFQTTVGAAAAALRAAAGGAAGGSAPPALAPPGDLLERGLGG